MTQGWFDALSEQKFFDQYQANEAANARYKASATPEIAARVGQIYSQSPWMTPGQVLSLAKGNASPQAVDAASQAQAKRVPALLDPTKPDDKGFFERNIFDKIKETTRWSFAALDTVKDLSQNVASQVFNPNDPAGFDGWFQSTSLGTMLSDSEQAGEGFFLGGKAAEKQAERARRVRGTINGSAWTIGRGAASLVFTPGSKAYGIASGLLDAVVAVGSDPTFLGGKLYAGSKGFGSLSELKSAQAAIQGVRSAEELSAVQKLLKATTRADAGLTDAEQLVVDSSKFLKFWQTDARARRLVSNLGDPANNDAFSIFRDTFGGKIDITTAKRLAAAKSENEVLSVIADVTNRLDEANPNLLPTDIRQLPGAKFGAFRKQRSGLYNSFRHNRLFTTMPEQVVVAGTDVDNAKAVLNYGRLLDTIGTGKAGVAFSQTTEGRALLNKIMDAYESGAAASIKQVDEVFDETVKVLLRREGASEEQITNLFKKVKQAGDDTRAYFVDAAGRPEDGGFLQALLPTGQVDMTSLDDLSPEQISNLRLNSPGSVLELMDRTKILPDVREIRRISGNRMMKRALTRRSGEQRAAIAYSEYLQNKIWKPLTLATGGYIMRNMVDAQVRIATIGKEGFFNHPIRYMQWVMARKAPETITGRNFDEIIKAAVDDISAGDSTDRFVEVMTDGLKRNLEDPLAVHAHAVKNGAYELVTKQANRDRWFTGLGEEFRQLSQDGVSNAWAKGIPINEIIDYLRGTPKGREALRQFEAYLKTGMQYVDENGFARIVKVKEVDDNVLKAWIEKLAGSRVELKTGGDPDLKFAIGHRRVPFGPTQSIDSNSIALTDIVDGPRELGRGTVFRAGVDADGNEIFYLVTDAKSITGTKSSVIPEFDEPDQLSLTIRRVSNNDIIDTPEGRAEFAEFVKSRNAALEADGSLRQLPGTVKIAQRGIGVPESGAAAKALDRFTDWFFVGVYGKASQTFEKSPVFRQFYYEQVSKNIDLLSKEEAEKLLKYIEDSATRNGISVEDYVGGKKNLARINKVIESNKNAPAQVRLNPALVKEEGVLFHGTPQQLSGGEFSDIFGVSTTDANNLFGRGIYLTDSPDVGVSYTAKGAKGKKTVVDGKPVNKSGFVYKVKINPEAKFIDLRKPSPQLNEVLLSQLNDDAIEFLEQYSPSFSQQALNDFVALVNNGTTTGEQAFSAFKKLLVGMETSEVDSIIQEVTVGIQGVADGLIYQGGVRRGGLGEHTAYVVLNNKAVSVTDELTPTISSFAGGEGTIKELDDFAQLVALNSTKEALYNASSRNNLEDIMRILIPFGVAYREVTGTYLRLLAEDPTRIRKAQLIYSGAENFDPDNDGQGFFYKDPTTGENVFNFPFSGELTKLVTGVEAPLQGGVKRLSLGLQVIPSLGPVGQIAASELIPDSPKFDDVVGVLLPYGRGSFNAMPSWAGKIRSALRDDPTKLESIYANTYIDTLRALSTSGDYDLDDEQSKANLMADAKSKAKILTALRGFAQFVGPTAPSLEYVVKTKSGDVYASAMVQEFYRLQNENYDTAVPRFIELFGDDALLYLSSKSKSVAGGLEASEQFGDWERDNENLLEQFPATAGYFAPGGDDFSFEVWDRQLRKGRRERLSDTEIIKQAQYRMGASIYRSYRTQVGAYPTAEQRAWLGNVRKEINKRYAGFPVTPVFTVGEFESKLAEMRTLIELPQLQNNGVAKSIATYLDYRDKAVQQYVASGGKEGGFDTAKKAEPLRDYLVSIGQALIQQNPDFARIWDRELSSEVDK